MAMPWAGRVKAILQMGYAGEGAGKALADLLFRLLKNESVPRVFNISLYKGVTLKGK